MALNRLRFFSLGILLVFAGCGTTTNNSAPVSALAAGPPIVFFGDSLTFNWDLSKAFAGQPFVNKGVTGDSTGQMLQRLQPDVIAVNPRAVVILGGTNDILGAGSLDVAEQNLTQIHKSASAAGIRVVLCTVPPLGAGHAWQNTSVVVLNDWIRSYAAANSLQVADYYPTLVSTGGSQNAALFNSDGIHLNSDGYTVLKPIVSGALNQTLSN